MDFLHTEIGSAKDNLKSPIHNWYKFTAGFSHKFVDEIIALEGLKSKRNASIFDAFAGCGTTLVSSQKAQVKAVGNEGQEFMYDVIRAKLGWKINEKAFNIHLNEINDYLQSRSIVASEVHPLLNTLYNEKTIIILYLLKEAIEQVEDINYMLFFKLALSQTLHKVSIHPIAVPYISRSKTIIPPDDTFLTFKEIAKSMLTDIVNFYKLKQTSKIFLQDSRNENKNIANKECSTCITSPPYLNNLDYGEVSKVHTHFFNLTNTWGDITKNVRHKLVTGSTTHYCEKDFSLEEFFDEEFCRSNPKVMKELLPIFHELTGIAKERGGSKSFDILTLLYFKDMYLVLKEIRRVLRARGKSYLILGDSAPYGVYIPTTELLGKIALNTGFKNYTIQKIRKRGTKWKSLRFRHSLELSENVLILK